MEFDVDVAIPSEKGRLEDKIEMLNKTIREITMKKTNIWCLNCREEGHTNDMCQHQTVKVIQIEQLCDIYHNLTQHATSDYPYNLRKQKQYWCAISQESMHNTVDYVLNVINHRSVYKTKVIPTDQNQSTNYRSTNYSRGGYSGWGRFYSQGGHNQNRYQNNPPRWPRCWSFHKDSHFSVDCPYKDKIDLKFCNTCGVGEHSLEDCPIMLEKIMNKKIVKTLSYVPKINMTFAKNLQVITRHGTKTGLNKNEPDPIKIIQKDDYPNTDKQKELYKDAKKVFQELSDNEEQYKSNTIKEILHLLSNEKATQRQVDVLSILKEEAYIPKITKNIAYMGSNIQNDFDPQVDLQINELLIPKVVLDFGSQENILTKNILEKLGRPQLVKSKYYLKLDDRGLIEPLGLCKNIETTIMGITVKIDFKVIE